MNEPSTLPILVKGLIGLLFVAGIATLCFGVFLYRFHRRVEKLRKTLDKSPL